MLPSLELHAALTQAITSIISVLIAAGALAYTVSSLKALQRQANANVSLTIESFRPIIEIRGGELGRVSKFNFINKGNGPALNFRWREDSENDKWRAYTTNVLTSKEEGTLIGEIDWKKGLVLAYNSVAHREEILTRVKFHSNGQVSNQHVIEQGEAKTRLGWAIANPEVVIPGYLQSYIDSLPPGQRILHWWRLRTGKERRLQEPAIR